MNTKLWNGRLWVGFGVGLLALVVLISFLLSKTPRPAFWVSLGLLAFSAALLFSGLKRAFTQPQAYRGRIAGPIFAVVVLGAFGLGLSQVKKYFPVALHAPQVGQKAPEFTLRDINGNSVAIPQLISASFTDSAHGARTPKGVLLVFYRGYW